MKRTTLFRHGAAAIALLTSLAASPPAHPADPDFSQIEDILLGRRELLPVDDLVVTFNDPNLLNLSQELFKTTNGAALTKTPFFATQPDLGPAKVLIERMYELPRDVTVVAAYAGTNTELTVIDFNKASSVNTR